MVGIVNHLSDNNITLVIHHALQVTGSPETINSKPDYSYYHSDHPAGNRIAHLGIYSQSHWIHFGTPDDTGPLFTAKPNYGFSKIVPSAQPNLLTSNTPLNTMYHTTKLKSTTSTQHTYQQSNMPTHQQFLHSMPQTLGYIKTLPPILVGAESALIRLAPLLSPVTTSVTISNYSKASEATAYFLKAFPAALSVTHGPGRSKTNRRRFKA
jgi:hypothetical protein